MDGLLNNPPVIRIRGLSSLSLSSFPLVVVDGIPISTGDASSNNRANIAIAALEENKAGLDAALASKYVAEAKFIRALNYLALVQIFALPYTHDNGQSPGLPLRILPEVGPENNAMPRSSVGEIHTQIVKDLDDAIAGLASVNGNNMNNVIRAHKNAAIALKSRALLIKGDFPGVITEANKLVPLTGDLIAPTGVKHKLDDNIKAVFQTPFLNLESIFSFPMASTNAPGTQNQLGYYFNVGNVEYYLNEKGNGIYAHSQFRADDARKTTLTVINPAYGGPLLTKYSGESPFLDYIPILRYSEVLLNLAEAEAEAGSLARAKSLLEAVHHRSDPGYSFGNLTKQQLIEAILVERRIELLGEGFRGNDIVRRKQDFRSVGAGTNVSITDTRYIFPIPDNEIKANTDIN